MSEEVWSGHVPSLDRLKVFGCVAYAHIRQDKLDPRAVKCMFLGYPEGVKGFRLWCLEPGHKKCFISRDVTFNESEMAFGDSRNKGKSIETPGPSRSNIEVELSDRNQEGNLEQERTRLVLLFTKKFLSLC